MVHHSAYRLIIGKLNISSLRKKFGRLVQQVTENTDILTILKTKLGNSIPVGQCLADRYNPPFRPDHNIHAEGVILL